MLKLEHLAWTLPDGAGILHDVDLTVGDGRLVVVTGPNGGGKTTLAKLIAGIETPSAGRIVFDGADITGLDVTGRAKCGIAYAFQQPVRFKGLTVRSLLELAAGEKLGEDELCGLLGKVGLCANEYMDREMNAGLSGGEIKRIEIAMVMARKTRLTIFDEPEAGIDLWSFNNLIDVFKKLRREIQGSIIIISHQERILNIADEIVVLADGEITAHGPRDEILPTLLSGDSRCQFCPKQEEAQTV